MKEIIESYNLNKLGDKLIEVVKNRTNFFDTLTIIFPSIKMQQWFKTYWLQTQSDVLMNVEFINISEALLNLIKNDKQYKILNKDILTSLIIKHLSIEYVNNKLPEEIKEYLTKNNNIDSIKLYDLANKLTSLFLEYENDNFKIFGWQEKIYAEVLLEANNNNYTTLGHLFHYADKVIKVSDERLYFFGFSNFTKLQETIIDEYAINSNVTLFLLELDNNFKKEYSLTSAPSKLREIEDVHSQICKLLLNPSVKYSDFLILAKDISIYEGIISRVFNQDDKDFPNIPYVINDRKKTETNISSGIKKLFEIFNKKYFTRTDFLEVVSNKDIQQVRNITDEDVKVFQEAIISMNIYRNGKLNDDWEYAKKRMILSKVVGVNDVDDNLVELSNHSYIPFTNIGLDNDTIIKFVKVIDDLNLWIGLLSDITYINNSNLLEIKNELSKWFSIKDDSGFETNAHYRNVLHIFNVWITMAIGNDFIPFSVFFYMLIDVSKVTLLNRGDYFVKGVTFTDFDIDSILSAKYVFFLNASSKEIPNRQIKSELDLRNYEINTLKEEKAFFLQYQNAIDRFYISYVNFDLKTHEEFYKSSFVIKLLEKINVKEENLSLDETRKWNKLFTKKGYQNKAYYLGLLAEEKENNDNDKIEYQTELLKQVTVNNMVDYLKEPLKYKAISLFGYGEDQDDINEEYEPFELDNLTLANLTKKVMTEMLINKKLELSLEEKNNLYKTFSLSHKIPDINQIIEKIQFENVIKTSCENVRNITEKIGNDYEVVQLGDLVFGTNLNQWILSCDKLFCRSIDGNNRKYVEIKKDSILVSASDYLFLYVISLMDASLLKHGTYNICLHKKEEIKFKITPTKARKLLQKIYDAMNDYSDNYLMDVNFINKYNIKEFNDIIEIMVSINDSPWKYFKDKKLFDIENQLGYNSFDFNLYFKDKLKKHAELIEYIEYVDESEVEGNE